MSRKRAVIFLSSLLGTAARSWSSSSSSTLTPVTNETWVNASGVSCRDSILDDQRCFIGVDYDSDVGEGLSPEQRCWNYCQLEGYEFVVAIAYARPRDGVCCCQSFCSCFEDSDGDDGDGMAVSTSIFFPDRCDQHVIITDTPNVTETPVVYDPDPGVPLDVVAGATCGSHSVLLETCTEDNALVDVEACWESCGTDYAVVVNGTTCCCHFDCECLEAEASSLLARPLGHTVGDCVVVEDPAFVDQSDFMVAYRNADCGFSDNLLDIVGHGSVFSTSSSVAMEHATAESDNFRRCFEWCQEDAANNGTELAAAVSSSDGSSCVCFDTCECLESGLTESIALVPSNVDAYQCGNEDDATDDLADDSNSTHIIEEGDDLSLSNLPEDAEDFEATFDTFAKISCYSGENRLCFYNLDYADDASDWVKRYECWSWCNNGDYAATYGSLAATFGNPDTRECCCVSSCGCFDEQPSSRFLLSLSRNVSDVPRHCEEEGDDGESKKKKGKVGPIDRSDIWWIVLIAIVALVALGFFVAVEEIDKSRRKDALLRKTTKPPFAPDSDEDMTASDSKSAEDLSSL